MCVEAAGEPAGTLTSVCLPFTQVERDASKLKPPPSSAWLQVQRVVPISAAVVAIVFNTTYHNYKGGKCVI